jgi:hypothetical protein
VTRRASRCRTRAGWFRGAEVEEGKIVRYRDYFDRAQMYEPLGLMHLLTG